MLPVVSVLIVSTALRAGGKTSALARAAAARCQAQSAEAEELDLAAAGLPLCDGEACYQNAAVQPATAKVGAADAVLLCFPIYNYQANAAAKNFVELTNGAWKGKVVGLAANGGTARSFLAPLPLANSLMVDHRCVVVPRFVFALAADFSADGSLGAGSETAQRVDDLVRDAVHLARCWPLESTRAAASRSAHSHAAAL